MSINSYRDLKVWQFSMDLVEQIYCITENFPKHEVYQLSSQMQRAAVSIPSNIAEGHARESTKEFVRYLSITLGSLAELETQVMLAQRRAYIDKEKLIFTLSQTDEIGRMLRGLQKSLKTKLGTRY
ncbi:four helix bundle protein [Halotia branconii]|uniref:Four helix bundle protein n=1 Tax=Halotia branconii CENA392 TaxID=1539056 RepID=A0AAJ6P977_9CYAN|nr:four helix bundle protein [Halotia branconii]WGV25544.1 four helix bundle protein [Halotia branconii CENA392]